MSRKIKIKPSDSVVKCPKCGNNTEFTVHSEQCAEDCCEIWASCKCGYCPSDYDEAGSGHKVEDVWGGTDDNNCFDAIRYSWSEAIESMIEKQNLSNQS